MQRSALSVIINCVCGPSEKVGIFSVPVLNIFGAFLEPIDYFSNGHNQKLITELS